MQNISDGACFRPYCSLSFVSIDDDEVMVPKRWSKYRYIEWQLVEGDSSLVRNDEQSVVQLI